MHFFLSRQLLHDDYIMKEEVVQDIISINLES